jgi:hypothetical protein
MSTAHCWKGEKAPPKQNDVEKLLPDLQLEAVVFPRTNKFSRLCCINLIVTEILILVILAAIVAIYKLFDNIKYLNDDLDL